MESGIYEMMGSSGWPNMFFYIYNDGFLKSMKFENVWIESYIYNGHDLHLPVHYDNSVSIL